MKKIFALLAVLVLLGLIIGGIVFFDYNRQNQKMRAVESRLELVADRVKTNPTAAQSILREIEMELVQLSGRWITARKTLAELEIAKLKAQLNAKENNLMSTDELKKAADDLLRQANKK